MAFLSPPGSHEHEEYFRQITQKRIKGTCSNRWNRLENSVFFWGITWQKVLARISDGVFATGEGSRHTNEDVAWVGSELDALGIESQ